MLTFDEAKHEYRWSGKVVPSVTAFLDRLHDWAGVPRDVLEAAKERGTYVHRMTELYDLGELDEEANALVNDGQYVPYLKAWQQFVLDHSPNWLEIEHQDYSKAYGYAGTWDRFGVLELAHPGTWLIDVKTSQQPHRVWGLQTAAYRQIRAERDASSALARRATVQLKPDGTYRFLEWREPSDWHVFHSLLTLTAWSKA